MMYGAPKLLKPSSDCDVAIITIRTAFGKLLFPGPYGDDHTGMLGSVHS